MIPKFRAFDKKHKKMIRVISLNWYEEITDYNVVGLFPNTESVARFWNEVDLMESTYLNDRNDDEIYAGDIVLMPWTVYDEPELFVVKTYPGHAARVDNGYKGRELWLRHNDCEIVGNIYENPELLEVD